MKRILKDIINIILAILVTFSYLFTPLMKVEAKEATTIAELKEQLEKLKKEKQDNINKKEETQSEIKTKKNNIYKAYKEQEEIAKEVEDAKAKVEEAEEALEETGKDIDNILKYYQLTNNSNEYIGYITGASSTTELIMRASAVEQISTYYKNKLEELKNLIKEKEELQVELHEKDQELDKKIDNYSNALSQLNDTLAALTDISLDIDEQIKAQESTINYYKSVCDSETQKLSTCTNDPQSYGWLKPLVKGRITSNFGWRNGSFHNAYDIGGNAEGTPEYAAAAGRVAFTVTRSSCGGNRAYILVTVNGVRYTLEYAHMLELKVKAGQVVTTDTVIGTVGGYSTSTAHGGYDRCSGGMHLHFGVAKGWYTVDYSAWSKFIANAIQPPGFPAVGVWWYKR